MKLFKPKFWQSNNRFFPILLLPLTYIVILYVFLKKTFRKKRKCSIPVVCVGNIYIGGTGKTPLSIHLAKEVEKKGKKPAIIRKYYKAHGDEHNLITNYFENLFLEKNRLKAIDNAYKKSHDIAILDDGLQEYQIKKDLSIVCFNEKQFIGNGFVIPSGPLRERLNALRDAHIVIINGEKNTKIEKKILKYNENLEIYYSRYHPLNLDDLKKKPVVALAGIANPNNFFELIEKNNINITQKLVYPDHYQFSKKEISKLVENLKRKNFQIIMTEKDFFKIKDYNIPDINFLKVRLIINDQDKLIKRIMKLYDKTI